MVEYSVITARNIICKILICPHCGMRNKLRQYAQAKQKDPGEELVDSAVAAGSAVARGIGRGLMSGFKMAKQAAENSKQEKGEQQW